MKIRLVLLLSSLLSGLAGGVNIVRLDVPGVVEADSSPVVLDCEFEVHEWERPGLVLQWYIYDVHLVYQWIPPRLPQVLGVLAGRINTTYKASQDPIAEHRALYIPRPHPVLSGQYSCTVSTFEDEDTRSAHLLVWKAPRRVELKYWRPSEHLVNITCVTTGAAPKPEFTLFTHELNSTKKDVKVRGKAESHMDGLWEAGAWGLILWAATPPKTVVGCTLTLPGTQQTHTTTRVYYPDLPILTTTTTTTTTTTQAPHARGGKSPRHGNGSHASPGAATSFFASNGRSANLTPTCCRHCLILVAAAWAARRLVALAVP